MKQPREFIFACEHMGGTTWTVEHQLAIEGEADEVVRCRDCEWYAHLRMMCRRADFTVMEPEGYCKWGRRKA